MKKNYAYAYCRSNEKNHEQDIILQKAGIKQFAKANNIKIKKCYTDECDSECTKFYKMIQAFKKNPKVKFLLVPDFKQLEFNSEHSKKAFEILKELKIITAVVTFNNYSYSLMDEEVIIARNRLAFPDDNFDELDDENEDDFNVTIKIS